MDICPIRPNLFWTFFHTPENNVVFTKMQLTMNVKEQRERLGLSQAELADKTGIPRERIAKWEQRNSKPKSDDYKLLEEFFKKSAQKSNRNGMDKSPASSYPINKLKTETAENDDSDIYSVNRRPVEYEKEVALLREYLEFAKDQNKYLQGVINGLLEKKKESRYASARSIIKTCTSCSIKNRTYK